MSRAQWKAELRNCTVYITNMPYMEKAKPSSQQLKWLVIGSVVEELRREYVAIREQLEQ